MSKCFRFALQEYKGKNQKNICPECGKKTFVFYVDRETGMPFPPRYGRCDREDKCAYHLNPYLDGYTKTILEGEGHHPLKSYKPSKYVYQPKPEPTFMPVEIFKQSLYSYQQNNFVKWLLKHFDAGTVNRLISRYYIGTSNHWPGATVFWQIDLQGNIRGGKIMLFSPVYGKRIQEPYPHINWMHKILPLPNFKLDQCYFGTHLLISNREPVALVESEKTALVASIYFPQFLWLAVGGLSRLNQVKSQVLAGRKVYLFPDLGGYQKWSAKAKELSAQLPGTLFKVSDLLELHASQVDKGKGLDLADYLIQLNYREFLRLSCK